MLLRTITSSIIGASLLFFGSVSTAGVSSSTWSWASSTNILTPQSYQTTERLVPLVIDAVVIITAMGLQEPPPTPTVSQTPPKQDPEEPNNPTKEPENSLEEFLDEGSFKFTKIDNHLSPLGQGTGFFIGKNLILTNHHVIKNGVKNEFIIQIRSQRYKWYKGRVIASDKKTDLAIMEIIEPDNNVFAINPLQFVNDGNWTLGEKLFAIGHPHGLYWSITEGVLSNAYRRIQSPWQRLIQTDTSLNPGNSGGPLFNMHGQVVGVNVLLLGKSKDGTPVDSGLNFAVRSDLAKHVTEELRVYNYVRRPRLGMSVRNRPGLDEMGIIVDEISDDSPASRSDLLPNDIITHVDDIRINVTYDFFAWFVEKMPGDKVIFVVERQVENQAGLTTIIVNIPVLLEELQDLEE